MRGGSPIHSAIEICFPYCARAFWNPRIVPEELNDVALARARPAFEVTDVAAGKAVGARARSGRVFGSRARVDRVDGGFSGDEAAGEHADHNGRGHSGMAAADLQPIGPGVSGTARHRREAHATKWGSEHSPPG